MYFCHTSHGQQLYLQFSVSYRPGDDITKHFSGLTPKPGQTAENFSGDESYEDRLRQWTFKAEATIGKRLNIVITA